MRNRETLGNQTFPDMTAWRGIRNADRANVLFSSLPEEPKPINRIVELNEELKAYNALSNNPNLTQKQRSQCKLLQQQRREELHNQMTKAGHKPIRTKVKPRCF